MANAKYFLKRFAMALLTIFLVACLTFLLMNAVPEARGSARKRHLPQHWQR